MKLGETIKAIFSLLFAVFLTLGIGSVLGYPLDADRSLANIARMNEIARENKEITSNELDKIYEQEGFNEAALQVEGTPLSIGRSIIKWHSFILVVSVIGSLILFRPKKVEVFVVGLLIGTLMWLWAGMVASILLFFPVVFYCLIPLGHAGGNRKT